MHRQKSFQISRIIRGGCLLLGLLAVVGCSANLKDSGARSIVTPGSVVRLDVPVESESLLDQTSVGAGFMISPRIGVTAAHVLEHRRAGQPVHAEVEGQRKAIDLIGQDSVSDVAVFRINEDTSGLPVLRHGSAKIRAGERVLVAGFPLPEVVLGSRPSLTGGIISAVDRTVMLDGVRHAGLIQLDAVSSYGNSGGPVMDAQGRVIGMLVLAASGPNGEWRGAAFALPIGRVERSAQEILSEARAATEPALE